MKLKSFLDPHIEQFPTPESLWVYAFKDYNYYDVKNLWEIMNNTSNDYKRKDMPRIPSDEVHKFQKILYSKSIDYSMAEIDCNDIVPIQKDIYAAKIIKTLSLNYPKIKPIIVSKDYKIVDGHHRWAASIIKDVGDIECLVVDLNIEDLLKVSKKF